jgi:DNA helicase-2/ATP-dependent DNA helicase PcrA
MLMNASLYQKEIFAFIHQNEALASSGAPRRHLIVKALAGSGKTTTVRECIRIASDDYGLSIAYAMFTRDTVDEFKAKNSGQRWIKGVNTAHGFGNAALRRKFGSVRLDKDKLKNLYLDLFVHDELDPRERKLLDTLQPYVCRLTAMAKDAGVGLSPESPIDSPYPYHAIISHHELLSDLPKGINQDAASNTVVEMATKLLIESNSITDRIDYPDMIYLALLYNAHFEQHDYVFIDEAQDSNATRRTLYRRMLKPWGSMIVVGDSHQAIFGFSGADVGSLRAFRDELNAEELPLSICYRCSTSVIRHAQRIVPNIESAPDAPEGSVTSIRYPSFIADLKSFAFTPDDVILCRFNAPNTALAFRLIRNGIPCRIEGRDIGFGLIKLADRLGDGFSDDPSQLVSLRLNVLAYAEAQVKKHTDAGRPGKAQSVVDRCDCLLEVIARAQELGLGPSGVSRICREMFQDSRDGSSRKDLLTLSSIHKAKGREWHRVFLLGRDDFMPSPWAKLDWEIVQEDNLIYVATTRAKLHLIEINELPE